jgi:chorismate lyase/3-hydroxybenzoate synthase
MPMPPAPTIDYVPADAAGAPGDGVLAQLHFAAGSGVATQAGEIVVPLDPVAGEPARVERWHVEGPVRRGRDGEVEWSCGGGWLMVSLRIAEADHGGPRAAAAHAYRLLLQAIGRHGHPHLARVWNYLADINAGDGDDERYRQFTVGRAEGMEGIPAARFPAATAIGRVDGVRELVVFALSAQAFGVPVENPRQVSAYRYPREYGPVPPSFARAMRLDGARPTLLVSGTASVVGHATAHDSSREQAQETLRNLDALLGQAGMDRALAGRTWLRGYLRDPADAGVVRQALAECGVADSHLVCLHGEICRRDLLLEIDGVVQDLAPPSF